MAATNRRQGQVARPAAFPGCNARKCARDPARGKDGVAITQAHVVLFGVAVCLTRVDGREPRLSCDAESRWSSSSNRRLCSPIIGVMLRLAFDAGTLVLRGLAAPCPDSASLDVPVALVWDPRIASYRAPAYRYSEVARWLKRVGLDAANEISPERKRTDQWSEPELRPYQHAALLSWQLAGRAGIVVLPTGAGKTRVACAAMAAVRCSVLCVVPTRVLLHQWRDEIARYYKGPRWVHR